MNLSNLVLKISSDGASATCCGNMFQQFTTLAKEAHSAKFQWSVLVQFIVMSSKLYSVGSHEELPVVHIFDQYFSVFCMFLLGLLFVAFLTVSIIPNIQVFDNSYDSLCRELT